MTLSLLSFAVGASAILKPGTYLLPTEEGNLKLVASQQVWSFETVELAMFDLWNENPSTDVTDPIGQRLNCHNILYQIMDVRGKQNSSSGLLSGPAMIPVVDKFDGNSTAYINFLEESLGKEIPEDKKQSLLSVWEMDQNCIICGSKDKLVYEMYLLLKDDGLVLLMRPSEDEDGEMETTSRKCPIARGGILKGLLYGVLIGLALLLVVLFVMMLYKCKKNKRSDLKDPNNSEEPESDAEDPECDAEEPECDGEYAVNTSNEVVMTKEV